MRRLIVVNHVILGCLVIAIVLNAQVTRSLKIHYTAHYYSADDLANPTIASHVQSLRLSESTDIARTIAGTFLGLSSLIGAVALARNKSWARGVLLGVTGLLCLATVQSNSKATGLVSAAGAAAAAALLLFTAIEVFEIVRERSKR